MSELFDLSTIERYYQTKMKEIKVTKRKEMRIRCYTDRTQNSINMKQTLDHKI